MQFQQHVAAGKWDPKLAPKIGHVATTETSSECGVLIDETPDQRGGSCEGGDDKGAAAKPVTKRAAALAVVPAKKVPLVELPG